MSVHFCAASTCLWCWLSVSTLGTNFAAILVRVKSFFRILWTLPVLTLHCTERARTVRHQSTARRALIFLMVEGLLAVLGPPDLGWSRQEQSGSSLKRLTHALTLCLHNAVGPWTHRSCSQMCADVMPWRCRKRMTTHWSILPCLPLLNMLTATKKYPFKDWLLLGIVRSNSQQFDSSKLTVNCPCKESLSVEHTTWTDCSEIVKSQPVHKVHSGRHTKHIYYSTGTSHSRD